MRQAALPINVDRGHYTPNLKRRGLKSSEAACSYVTTARFLGDDQVMTKVGGEKKPCHHRSFLYAVNHLVVSLCICHATRLSKRVGLKVRAA